MLLITTIVLRIISMSGDERNVDTACQLLHKIRSAVQRWIENLVSTLHAAVDSEQVSKAQQRLLKTSALCKMTYDVDAEHYPKVMDTTDDLKIWVLCSIRIRENYPGDDAILPADIGRLLLRDMKVSHSLYLHVRSMIIDDGNSGLDFAIAEVWLGFRSGSTSWDLLSPQVIVGSAPKPGLHPKIRRRTCFTIFSMVNFLLTVGHKEDYRRNTFATIFTRRSLVRKYCMSVLRTCLICFTCRCTRSMAILSISACAKNSSSSGP